MSKSVSFSQGIPSWSAIQAAAAKALLPLAIKMIDNLPAFPNEEPEDGWKEIRFSTTAGMMTLRKNGHSLDCVIWGNADAQLTSEWQKLVEILSVLGNPS
ncbi:hypothetical protein KIH39_16330 [Telmatocola sphagniphila]|uniref:Uncharacterized protein n=1 Tax=Telmatocola sphagniphila TaxID=1123043 RepID=A0A8E6ETQ8_9BACT|nr:hypothetical protein [Telmatocola sphagniphila]QVL30415.1 hypothetical protein KIH39_16330 [Telmatocola sphagniphila]